MKKLLVVIGAYIFSFNCVAQNITNIVLLTNENEVTENIKKAKSFIVVKRFDSSFQRLDYGIHAPLQLLRTYKGAEMKILHGKYIKYYSNGYIEEIGDYLDNEKNGDWYLLNDTGARVQRIKYLKGIEIERETINPTEKPDTTTKPGDVEASFPGGQTALVNFLVKNIDSDVANSTKKGGKIRVLFTVQKVTGAITDIYLQKSAEFVLDEEGIRVVRAMPPWKPAMEMGKPINAYRIQPLSFRLN